MNIGIVGAGAIATFLMKKINQDGAHDLKVNSVFVRNHDKYTHLKQQYNVKLFDDLDAFLESDIDVVVEAANIKAVHELFTNIIPKKDIVLISIGAFADAAFYEEMNRLAESHGRTIHLPSGAVGGLDLLQNAHPDGGIKSVSLKTRKPAHTLIDDESLSEEVIIFEGKASEAIKQYPRNINVSIILSLAGLGTHQTDVTIIADPTIDNNIHTVEVEGDFGTATLSVINNPLEENPKTSHLAAMSVLGTLKRIRKHIKIGG